MKSLPPGNFGLCIAHPGHELRLHGFLEQAKPFVWILTDGSHRTGQDIMFDSIKCIDRATKNGKKSTFKDLGDGSQKKIFKFSFPNNPPEEMHIKDLGIYEEVITGRTEFFLSYIDFIASNAMKYELDFLVSDSREGYNICHEVTFMMTELAIKAVKKLTGRVLEHYDYPLYKPFNDGLDESSIRIQLDEEGIDRKLTAMMNFPMALTDLRPNVSLDYNVIIEMRKMENGEAQVKEMLKQLNPDFLKYEYLRPANYAAYSEKPCYETAGEKAVEQEKYFQAITYEKHLKPLYDKLYDLIIGHHD